MIRLALVAAAAALLAAPAGAAPAPLSFGREGGSIRPFTVTIAADGAVHASGPVKVGRTRLTTAQVAALRKVAATNRLSALPATMLCPRSLPDFAGTWIALGTQKRVVRGSCVPRFANVW
jgi:hypothetical protein